MMRFDLRVLSLLVFIIIKLTIGYSVSVSSSLESEIDEIMNRYINKDIKLDEKLHERIKMAIRYVLLEEKYLDSELNRKEEILIRSKWSQCDNEQQQQQTDVDNTLKTFLRALPTYKAGALIANLEEKFKNYRPDHCENCLEWGHLHTNCTNQKATFVGLYWADPVRSSVRTRRNYWLWMLRHYRNDTEISRLSEYLTRLYDTANLTDVFESKPNNYADFELHFCHYFAEIYQEVRHMTSSYNNDDQLRQFVTLFNVDTGFPLHKVAEYFLKAFDRWIDFDHETVSGSLGAGQSTSSKTTTTTTTTTTTSCALESEANRVANVFLGEDLKLRHEILFKEVKAAIQYVLTNIKHKQTPLSNKDQDIRRITEEKKEKENEELLEKKTKLRTISIELWTHKAGEMFRSIDDSFPPPSFSSNSLDWGHTHTNCTPSKIPYNQTDSIAEDLHNRTSYWNWRLQKDNSTDWQSNNVSRLLERLKKEYDSGNFTMELKPKPENFPEFKSMFAQAMGRIDQYVRYLLPPEEYHSRPLAKDQYLYGVPLYKFTLVFLKAFVREDRVVIDHDR